MFTFIKVLIFIALLLASCRFSDQSYSLKGTPWWVRWVEPDRIEFYENFDASRIESIRIFLLEPTNIEIAKTIPALVRVEHDKDYTNYAVFPNRPAIDQYYNIQILTLSKNEILSLKQEIQEYGNRTLELLKRNEKADFVMTGRSNFTDGKDTSKISKDSAEYYYLCNIHFKTHPNTFHESSFYQNEFTIHCWDDTKHYVFTELTLPRSVGKEHTYKLISSIIAYKNKQIDSINVGLQKENEPLLEKYSWYNMK